MKCLYLLLSALTLSIFPATTEAAETNTPAARHAAARERSAARKAQQQQAAPQNPPRLGPDSPTSAWRDNMTPRMHDGYMRDRAAAQKDYQDDLSKLTRAHAEAHYRERLEAIDEKYGKPKK